MRLGRGATFLRSLVAPDASLTGDKRGDIVGAKTLRRMLLIAAAGVVMAAMVAVMPAGATGARTRGTFTNIVIPGATNSDPHGINDFGVVGGSYTDSTGLWHGFVDRGGKITTIDDPSAGTTATGFGQGTGVEFVSDLGEIYGVYVDEAGDVFGFVLRGKKFTTIEDPSAVYGTAVEYANNLGEIVGIYWDSSGNQHGFTDINGNFTTIDDPACASHYGTYIGFVNDWGTFTGSCGDNSNQYIYRNGSFTPAPNDPAGVGPSVIAFVTDLGEIGCDYVDASGVYHGCTDIGGIFTTIDDPLATSVFGTYVESGNNLGELVGYWVGESETGQGFAQAFIYTPWH